MGNILRFFGVKRWRWSLMGDILRFLGVKWTWWRWMGGNVLWSWLRAVQ